MRTTTITSRPEDTRKRVAELQDYFDSHVLHHDAFRCSAFEQCRGSHKGAFFEGQLHHVGRHYDLYAGDRPLRVVVVGQEYGNGPSMVSLAERSQMILSESGLKRRFKAEEGFPARNRHMRGTTSVLRLLFDQGLGTDHAREWLNLAGAHVHIFDAFSMVNFLLCSAVAPAADLLSADAPDRIGLSRPGRSTSTMQRNCARHFRRTIEILEPTVLVAQGKSVFGWLQLACDRVEQLTDHLYRATVGTVVCLVAAFSHPSAHGELDWGNNDRSPYLASTVQPTVARILDLAAPSTNPGPRLRPRPSGVEV